MNTRKKLEPVFVRGMCIICKSYPQKGKGKKNGVKIYGTDCDSCHRKKYKLKKSFRKHKGDKCCFCGFIPINRCQLDVDHIDGNHKNNHIDNLQTLCANCHRLKTFLKNEGIHGKAN